MLTKIATSAAISVIAILAVAGILVATDQPRPLAVAAGLDFGDRVGQAEDGPLTIVAGQNVRFYDGPQDAPLVVLVHGSGWYGQQFHQLATRLAATGKARVLVPDLRGHGTLADPRGDVNYIGQLEDDLAALIQAKSGGQPVVMVGHSSGGGLIVRMAGGLHNQALSGVVLLARYLGYNAPSALPGSGHWAKVQTRRIIGLSILNAFRITALNHLTVIQFRFGDLASPSATRAYSYRLNTSYAPRRNWADDISKLPSWTLVAGTQDEAMNVDGYAPAMANATAPGQIISVPGVNHLDIVDHAQSFDAILAKLDEVAPRA